MLDFGDVGRARSQEDLVEKPCLERGMSGCDFGGLVYIGRMDDHCP